MKSECPTKSYRKTDHPYTEKQVAYTADITGYARGLVRDIFAYFHEANITLTFPDPPEYTIEATDNGFSVFGHYPYGKGSSKVHLAWFKSEQRADQYVKWCSEQEAL